MKPEASPFKFSVVLFLFSCYLLFGKLFGNVEVHLAAYAQLPAGNRAFQKVLSYQSADDQGDVVVRAPHCTCRDVGFECRL